MVWVKEKGKWKCHVSSLNATPTWEGVVDGGGIYIWRIHPRLYCTCY